MLQSQKDIITASIPFLEKNGVELTSKFYEYMIDSFPQVRLFFNKSHQITKKQPKILAFALLQYASNINDLTPLLTFVRQIVEKHVGLQVTADHYKIVGFCLLKTLKDILGNAANEEFIKAWEDAYWELANLLIKLEEERYEKELKIDHAWLGFKDAKISQIVQESKNVKSLYIVINEGQLPKFIPGQYVTIRLCINDEIQSREYSISNVDNTSAPQYYRISVKRIPGGVVSNHIHDSLKINDQIQITSAYGKLLENHLQSSIKSNNATFFIAGIGITPALSLIEYFANLNGIVKVYLSNHDLESKVFNFWFEELLQKHSNNVKVIEFISFGSKSSKSSNHIIHDRRISTGDIETSSSETNYFIIGPKTYMKTVIAGLSDIPACNINTEEFGPVST